MHVDESQLLPETVAAFDFKSLMVNVIRSQPEVHKAFGPFRSMDGLPRGDGSFEACEHAQKVLSKSARRPYVDSLHKVFHAFLLYIIKMEEMKTIGLVHLRV